MVFNTVLICFYNAFSLLSFYTNILFLIFVRTACNRASPITYIFVEQEDGTEYGPRYRSPSLIFFSYQRVCALVRDAERERERGRERGRKGGRERAPQWGVCTLPSLLLRSSILAGLNTHTQVHTMPFKPPEPGFEL